MQAINWADSFIKHYWGPVLSNEHALEADTDHFYVIKRELLRIQGRVFFWL